MTRFFTLGPLVALLLSTPLPARSEGGEVCGTHVVAQGDHLFALAKTYYDSADRAFALYSANRTLIGPDPNALTVGLELQIPCSLDGVSLDQATLDALPRLPSPAKTVKSEIANPQVRDAAAAADRAPQVVQNVGPLNPTGASMLASPQLADTPLPTVPNPGAGAPLTFRLLTGGPYPPFVGRDLPQGGLITDILARALSEMAGAPSYDIAFVDDRSAHLDLLLKRGGFDMGFPWIYPECNAPLLTDAEQILCADYIASEPLYEFVTEYYVRADNSRAEAVVPMDLVDGVLCRPVGYPVDDLVTSGLLPDKMTLVRATDSRACLQLLDAGEVDIASMDAGVSRATVRQMDVDHPLLVLDKLTQVHHLRVVARANLPRARERLDAVNAALRELSEAGTWYALVEAHLNGDAQ